MLLETQFHQPSAVQFAPSAVMTTLSAVHVIIPPNYLVQP